jgi:predicted nuclease of restriction endonuclease-like (RecB) superfamily
MPKIFKDRFTFVVYMEKDMASWVVDRALEEEISSCAYIRNLIRKEQKRERNSSKG